MKNKVLCVGSYEYNIDGWLCVRNLYQPAKKDGTPNNRFAARPSRRALHKHPNGHVRYYKDNVLKAERYQLNNSK